MWRSAATVLALTRVLTSNAVRRGVLG